MAKSIKYLDSSERKLVDFEIMVLILDLIDDMLPIRCQNIAILSLKTLCNVLESRVELSRSRNISTLSDLTSGAEMAATGLRIVRKWRRSTRHLLWSTLLRPVILIWIHFLEEKQEFAPTEGMELMSSMSRRSFLRFALRPNDQNNRQA